MSTWELYVTRNPMRAESKRAFRRFFGLGKRSSRAIQVGSVVIGILYLLALSLVYISSGMFPIPAWAGLEVLVLLLVASIGFYGTIAGERERRSWDLLRVAPVTRGQIVVGKFLGGVHVLCCVWLAMLPFLVISGVAADRFGIFSSPYRTTFDMVPPVVSRLMFTLLASATALLGAICALSVTMLMSARCKSSVGALSTSLGFLLAWNVIFPMFLGPLGAETVMGPMNPFMVATRLSERVSIYSDTVPADPTKSFLGFCAFALIATVLMVIWTERTLTFVENDVQFIPRRRDA